MRKAISGFTIVEILVTVSLIGILAALSIISYDSITASAHDSKRQASFSVIQDALESYFNKNGEYPSCSAMSQDSNTVATSVLSDIDATVLTSPSSASGTNSFASSCADLTQGSTSDYAYISDTSKYTLEYKKESTGDIVAIESQHAPTSTVADPTSAPSVSISYTNGNIVPTISSVSCTDSTAQYQINFRQNDGNWEGYTTWSSDLNSLSSTATKVGYQGNKYAYKAQARCYISNIAYSNNVVGAENSKIIDITTVPSTVAVNATTTSYANTTFSWLTSDCPTGTIPRYQYDFFTSYGFDFGWVTTTNTSGNFTTSTFNYTYSVKAKAQCYTNFASGGWSGEQTASYFRAIPSVWVLVVGGGGGGATSSVDASGGGGGGGGVISATRSVYNQGYGVTVGAGGVAGYRAWTIGGSSTFQDITAYGGGQGGWTNDDGTTGSSGGGGAGASSGNTNHGGSGTQGYPGGTGQHCSINRGAGGGGAGERGSDGCGGMRGGNGVANSITGSNVYYGGGGGGASSNACGAGGAGGGGAGGCGNNGVAGTANTGGGGGGGGGSGWGQPGGTGVVILRYNTIAMGAGGCSVQYQVGSDTVCMMNSSGTFQVY